MAVSGTPGLTLTAVASAPHPRSLDAALLPVDRARFQDVRVGSVGYGGGNLGICDLPAFQLIGFGQRPVGVLGMDLLGRERITFDFRRNMLYLQ
jgi:hypothetical protein